MAADAGPPPPTLYLVLLIFFKNAIPRIEQKPYIPSHQPSRHYYSIVRLCSLTMAPTTLAQPWKKNWPEGYEQDKDFSPVERGRTTERDPTPEKRNNSPSPAGGKGATPHAISMVDGTRVMRLDDRHILQQFLENGK